MKKRRNIHINDYGPKVYEYLQPGQKNLIAFGHGWGDTLMFMPVYEKIKEIWQAIDWHLYIESGQEKIFKSAKHWNSDDADYDFIFHIHYPMGEGSGKTKNATCCEKEIGIEAVEGIVKLNKYKSPLVAVHFQGTALPNSVNCPEDKAKIIWDSILKIGLVPIECHFLHMFHNPSNRKYDFIDCSVRGAKARLQSLIGLIQHCYAFIGVASGPLVTALSIMPQRTLMIENLHKFTDYVKGGSSIHYKDIDESKVIKFLSTLQKTK